MLGNRRINQFTDQPTLKPVKQQHLNCKLSMHNTGVTSSSLPLLLEYLWYYNVQDTGYKPLNNIYIHHELYPNIIQSTYRP